MDNLTLCRTMESICRSRAAVPSFHQYRWQLETEAWKERVHKEIVYRFQEKENTQADEYARSDETHTWRE
jgi:hypothetical protein